MELAMPRAEAVEVLLELGAITLTQDASSVFGFDDLLRESRAYDPEFGLTAEEAETALATMTTVVLAREDGWRLA